MYNITVYFTCNYKLDSEKVSVQIYEEMKTKVNDIINNFENTKVFIIKKRI